ncbi:MAG TPA: hypothetical protein DCO89_00650 [Clostridiales bacterium]|nr:hypothetical protein [Clostridiales bacterium]
MVENYNRIKNVLSLAVRLENLCEGFDVTTKSATLTSKIKVLLEISKAESVTPATLQFKVGLAKSNLAILCNKLKNEKLIEKKRDEFDGREISYTITEDGEKVLDLYLKKAQKNFERQLSYKNNMKQIDESVKDLSELVS